jgi:hypothetical protein
MNQNGKILGKAILETKAATIIDFLKSQRGTVWVTSEDNERNYHRNKTARHSK